MDTTFIEHLIWLGLTTLGTAFIGAYLAGYFKKKGENLATHEDINKVLFQVAAVTQTTKEIEGKISNDMWSKQKRWEIKRDGLFEALKDLGTAQTVLGAVVSIRSQPQGDKTDREAEYIKMHLESQIAFERAYMLAKVICSPAVRAAFEKVQTSMAVINHASRQSRDWANSEIAELTKLNEELTDLIRNDLAVDE